MPGSYWSNRDEWRDIVDEIVVRHPETQYIVTVGSDATSAMIDYAIADRLAAAEGSEYKGMLLLGVTDPMRAGFAPGEAKENWAILRALSAELGAALPWDSLAQLRARIVADVAHLGRIDEVAENEWRPLEVRDMGKADFRNAFKGFYLTNPIARASAVMGELAAMEADRAKVKLAAE